MFLGFMSWGKTVLWSGRLGSWVRMSYLWYNCYFTGMKLGIGFGCLELGIFVVLICSLY